MSTTVDGDNLNVPGTATLNKASIVAPFVPVRSTGVNDSASDTDFLILITASGVDIGLETAVGIAGRVFAFKLTVTGSATVTPNGSEKIDGASGAHALSSANKFIVIVSDGAGWQIMSSN